MAYNKAPPGFWPSYDFTGTRISVSLADLGLTAAQANRDTGDWRVFIVALLEALRAKQQALAPADRSAAMLIAAPVEKTIFGNDTITYRVDFYNAKTGRVLVEAP